MLRLRFGCQFAILVLLFATPEAQASSKPSEAELAAITARGVLLAEYDTAAWQATDTVQAAHPVEGRVGRYIARKTDAGWVVAFGRLNEAGNKFLLAYEAVQTANAAQFEVRSFDPVREDTSWNLAAAKAIETAMRDLGGTSRPYNIAVLPTDHENMYVYLYPAQNQGQTQNQQTAENVKPWDFRKNVVDLLRAKNGCSDWFNTGTGSAADIMSNVRITLFDPKGPIPDADARTSEDPHAPIDVNSKGRFYANSDNQLRVGDKYKPGSTGAREVILLHELAHKMQLIPHDGLDVRQSEKNTRTVIEHCADAIGP